MKVEPNNPVDLKVMHVLCYKSQVQLADGTKIAVGELSDENNAFLKLCKRLDPNMYYINVLVPPEKETFDIDQAVYYQLQEIGQTIGIHVQSVLSKTEQILSSWSHIQKMSSNDTLVEDDDD